ncbi:MAG TPA: hypothetical protein DEP20_01260 [Fusobacteria bacterium]|nr:hypothetical protein [Fusobacteriota bacterium]|tara:strand:+ start:12532 stop:12825 length:294 start_codon:yes stop_codon:yes gene_type:complete
MQSILSTPVFKNTDNNVNSLLNESDNFSFRIINPMEVENLTEDALAHLINLKQSFSISEECFENILVDISSIFGILDLECLEDLLEYRGIGQNKIIN